MMKKSCLLLAPVLLLGAAACAQSPAPLTTQQFCDGQQNVMTVLAPLINQFSGYIVPPAGATVADEQAAITVLVRNVLGSKCAEMRGMDAISTLQSQVAALQARVTALEASVATANQSSSAAQTNAAQAVNTVGQITVALAKLQAQVKSASAALVQ